MIYFFFFPFPFFISLSSSFSSLRQRSNEQDVQVAQCTSIAPRFCRSFSHRPLQKPSQLLTGKAGGQACLVSPRVDSLMGDVNAAMSPPDGEVTDDRSWPSL
jgi:hypothetical protein